MPAADSFRVTWSERVVRLGYVTACIDREGLERRRIRTRQGKSELSGLKDLKNSRFRLEFLNPTARLLNGFKISDIDQLILVLIFSVRVYSGLKNLM